MDASIIKQIEDIVGPEYVSTREDVLLTYSSSASMICDTAKPDVVVRPRTAEEVSKLLKLANKYRIPVTTRSGGSSLQEEVIPHSGGMIIEMMRFTDIKLFEDLRSVKVGAGITFGQLDKFLLEHDLWLPMCPESALVATVVGNVAVNGAGPGSSVYGSIAELVLGMEVVLPNGEIIQTGSEANPHAPGPFLRYAFGPDLTGLFIGSLGAFGVITSVSMKTFKRMKHFHHETYGFHSIDAAERFLLEIQEHEIHTVFASLYEDRVLDLFMSMLGDEYGIPEYEWPLRTVSMTIGRLREDELNSDIEMAKKICEDLGGYVIGITELPKGEWELKMWTFVRACYVHGWHWRTLYHHQPPSGNRKSVEKIWEVMDEYGFLGHTAGFLSGHASMNMYPHLYADPEDPEEQQKIRDGHQDLARRLFKTGAVPFKLAPYWKDILQEIPDYMDLLRMIKEVLDPNGIMNPGVLGGI